MRTWKYSCTDWQGIPFPWCSLCWSSHASLFNHYWSEQEIGALIIDFFFDSESAGCLSYTNPHCSCLHHGNKADRGKMPSTEFEAQPCLALTFQPCSSYEMHIFFIFFYYFFLVLSCHIHRCLHLIERPGQGLKLTAQIKIYNLSLGILNYPMSCR